MFQWEKEHLKGVRYNADQYPDDQFLYWGNDWRCMFGLVFGTFGLMVFAWWRMTRQVKIKKRKMETLTSVGHFLTQGRAFKNFQSSGEQNINSCTVNEVDSTRSFR